MSAHILNVRNANDGLREGLHWLASTGLRETSRNGIVLAAPGPVLTQYARPQERVLFSAVRDANPFFHLYEAVWMMAGRNDCQAVERYAKTMSSFANANGTLNGAYGHRWRSHFGYDQLMWAMRELRRNPDSRRVNIGMWDPAHDPKCIEDGTPDVPCNTNVYVEIRRGALNITVCNRSNDIVWGCYGANYVHMGFMQEVLAAALGVKVGTYTQMSNNFHLYLDRADVERLIRPRAGTLFQYDVGYGTDDRYQRGVSFTPVAWRGELFELSAFLDSCCRMAEQPLVANGADGIFLSRVFAPMMRAHAAYKSGSMVEAHAELNYCVAEDWKTAAREWLLRREAKNVAHA